MTTVLDSYSQPVRSLQTFLRTLSQHHHQIPPVIPDGIFGQQTGNAVAGFQETFSLPVTGEVDNEIWDLIIAQYDSDTKATGEPRHVKVLSSARDRIPPGSSDSGLYPIQGMLYEITIRFSNLGQLNITGTHDEASVAVVRRIQSASGLETTGVIDRLTWDRIARIYEVFVSDDRVSLAR